MNMNTKLIKHLLESMDDISSRMRDVIYNEYFDKIGNDKKYVLSMFEDAYESIVVFCYAMQNIALSQAGMLLRKVLEETSIVKILVEHPEFLPKFIEHYKLRIQLEREDPTKKAEIISKTLNVSQRFALKHLDYGWIDTGDHNDQYEKGMLKYAGFEELLPWKELYFDKFAHSSVTTGSLIDESGEFPIVKNFVDVCAYLFDYLCISFHNLTDFNFIFDNNDLFQGKFRNCYRQFKDNC